MDKPLTEKARAVVSEAQGQAIDHSNPSLEPEHVLVALLSQADGLVPTIVRRTGREPSALRAKAEQAVDRMPVISGGEEELRASTRFARMMREAGRAMERMADEYVSAEHLCDVSPKDLETYRWLLPDVIYKRAFHVVTENQRVLEAAEALERNDSKTFGKLMVDSHQSLKQDYEVSCRELDILVELAREVDGVLGSRMTGGGFGGCTITLLEASHINEFQETIVNRYYRATGLRPEIYDCTAASAAEELNPSQ